MTNSRLFWALCFGAISAAMAVPGATNSDRALGVTVFLIAAVFILAALSQLSDSGKRLLAMASSATLAAVLAFEGAGILIVALPAQLLVGILLTRSMPMLVAQDVDLVEAEEIETAPVVGIGAEEIFEIESAEVVEDS